MLGPLEVWHDDDPLPISAPMQRALLASLLSRLGNAVSLDTIVADLWGDVPPKTAVTTIRNYVRRLRAVFPEQVLQSTTAGYRLTASPQQVDVHRFNELVTEARRRGSVELYDRALALWRGEPLMNIGDVPLRAVQAPLLEESYLAGLERAIELRLSRGQHMEVLAGLVELNSRYPLRERLCHQLMIALYRSGRAAEALSRYRQIRGRLVTEVGMEPGPDLRRLETAILREDAQLITAGTMGHDGGPGRALTPAGPPPLCAPFLGREDEVAELKERLRTDDAPVHCTVYGPGGCGKSALAVRVGHELSARYPDGTLYVDVGGSTPGVPARSAADVVAMLIHALGGIEPRPDQDITELLRAYRVRLRGRRMLIIFDNVAGADQIRVALPDEPGCAAIITSRAPISCGDFLFHLDPLRPADAVELLGRMGGTRMVAAEPEAAAALAELCGRLPLALRLIATRAALRPHWPLATWVRLLDDELARLDQLRHEDVDVRASLLIGLDGLRTSGDDADQDAAALFPLLGLPNPPHITAALAAALTGWPVTRANRALESLLNVQMAFSPGPERYLLYDLVSVLAKERAPHRRAEPLARAVDWYVAAIRACSLTAIGARTDYGLPQEHPTDAMATVRFDRYGQVQSWLDRELPVMVEVLRQAVAGGLRTAVDAARIALQTLPFYFNSALSWTQRTALADMLLDHDPDHAAFARTHLAIVEGQRGNIPLAQRLLDQANEQLDSRDVYTSLLFSSTQGIVLVYRGDMAGARERFEHILRTAPGTGHCSLHAMALCNLADVHLRTGRCREALALLDQALTINRAAGHQLNVAINLNTMLQAYSASGDHDEVIRRAPEVRAHHDRLGDVHQRAEHLLTVANSLRAVGDTAAAESHLAGARDCISAISHREKVHANTLFDHLLTDIP
ncbi:AfsR/SARP family transcriptional regulator [Allonocardiopsis opalescens]|uniref:DNA-binding SARP family transcriptional activator n=1 Tax=Allonocardiopsis opalescens TaxID=1144618 RepID=A0A2T0PYD9_9ACTN|nr:BTAD domain-containing putative transcriptional regulator [Allonocardiopsis opalescens]PRX96565.1 DNA-binding SARP family transcriptional activator [Allonocardiopsis opalescens]